MPVAKPAMTINLRLPRLPSRQSLRGLRQRYFGLKGWQRYCISLVILTLIASLLLQVVLPYFDQRFQSHTYAMSAADKSVIAQPNDAMAKYLQRDAKSQTYNFNAAFSPAADSGYQVTAGGPKSKAVLHDDLAQGVTVTDAYNDVDFTMTPNFAALAGHQDKNQISYPIYKGDGAVVYTAAAAGVKEDILLRQQAGDTLIFSYTLGLSDQFVAKLLPDGSVGIYGSSLPLGNVSTSSDKDAALLQKARKNAKKDKLLFDLPAPVITENASHKSSARAVYQLKGDQLSVRASHLKQASYPLSIDPTVQISTVSEFYRNTSIESNADFDVTNNQITRGSLTGGTTATWTSTVTMNQARFLGGATAYNGYMYVAGGSSAASTANIAGNSTNMIEYIPISTATPSVLGVSPTLTWQSGNSIGLPAGGLSRFQMIGYKGFIYLIGGSKTDTTCASGNLSTTVYYAPVQVNGVLGNWQTTSAPSTARCSFGAAAYNGKIYIAGGKTDTTAASGTYDVSYASVNPDGTLTWTNNVAVTLPAARYGADLQAYNGYLYVVGGSLTGTLTNTVLYAALNTDGSIYGSGSANWKSTNVFATARENFGAVFTVVKNGYMYISGGCKAVNASQTCNTAGDAMTDTQLAQINADGSLGQWATTTSLTSANIGGTEVVWRSTIYNLGGCATTNAASLFCTTSLATTQYGAITTAGQASVLKTSANNLPTALFGGTSVVNNGYLYIVGGCITNSCQTGTSDTTNLTSYAPINNDGTLGAWTTGTQRINTTKGLAEIAVVAINGTLYAFGGYSYNTGGGAVAGNNTIWTITPNANGSLPTDWVANSRTMNTNEYALSALYFNGYIYTFGGCVAGATTFGCSTYSGAVTRYTVSGTTIGAGSTTNLAAIPTATQNYPNAAMGLAFYEGYIYLCGGANGSGGAANGAGQTQKCIYTQFTSTGTITQAWAQTAGSLNVGTSPDHPIRRGAAYASNGYLYVYSGHDGVTGTPVGTINIGKINPNTGNIDSNFTVSTTNFTAKWDAASAFANGNIYTIGGCTAGNPPTTCTTRATATEYFQIYNATSSATRAISSGPAIGTAATGNSAVASNGYLYMAGGCSAYAVATTTCTTAQASTQFAPLNPDGSIGTWASGPSLPAGRGFGCMVAQGGTLYYIGGANSGGTAQSSVYYSATTGSAWGSGSWAAVTTDGTTVGTLPAAKTGLSCATYNNRIYVTGGSASATTYYTPALATGGGVISGWTTAANTFTTVRSYHTAVAAGGYLYVIGGFDGTNYLSDVQFSQLNTSTGAPGAWNYTSDLPLKAGQSGAFAANGYIYVLGGTTGTASTNCLSTTFTASVNSTGDVGSWQQGVATSFSAISGQGTAYYNGYYYLTGGNDCTSNATTVSYGGEQSQAIRSIFTRYIDMVGDATPQKFVSNGTNAAVNGADIEKWRMTYSSSRQATNAFGAPTAITTIPFGSNPFTISAIDGTSTNQGVGRYWSLTFDIDQTQSFSFTDADTTQPAIKSYSFYYSPSGNTRLRNGRIFQDQTKQSLDAHP